MSAWPRPTTADIALRAFSSSPSRLFTEAALGMQNILLSDNAKKMINSYVRFSGQWQIKAPRNDGEKQWDLILVQWLEEVLYRSEVHGEWLVDCQLNFQWETNEVVVNAQISWIESENLEREIEIKAVTTHELQFTELKHGEHADSPWEQVPDFQGPGWLCDVVFDI